MSLATNSKRPILQFWATACNRKAKYVYATLSLLAILLLNVNNSNVSRNLRTIEFYRESKDIVWENRHRPSSFAIVQFDSRPITDESYWNSAAMWNWLYTKRHGHQYILYTWQNASTEKCISHDGKYVLADPWCKVKTMLQVQNDFDEVEYFLYLDSDAVVSRQFSNYSMSDMLTTMQRELNWTMQERPIVFNQDGPCWWCNQIEKSNYTWCLNAGTVFWKRSNRSTAVLVRWWESSSDPYDENPLGFSFRTQWPWEQDRQMSILHGNDEVSTYIQLASQPDQPYMDMNRGDTHWCLSHIESSNCYISHYCEDAGMKEKMNKLYGNYSKTERKYHSDWVGSYPVAYLDYSSMGQH